MRLYLDIETIPDIAIKPTARLVQPVNNRLTKPESIAKWEADNPPTDEAWRRGSLDPLRARVLCIGFAMDDGPTDCVWTDYGDARTPEDVDAEERRLLEAFAAHLEGAHAAEWVTWHGERFDLPVLAARAVRYGNRHLGRALPYRKFDPRSIDVASRWHGTNYREQYAHLDSVCRYLGVPTKDEDGIDGSQVFDAWRDGEMPRIATYCEHDVARVRSVYRAMDDAGLFGGALPETVAASVLRFLEHAGPSTAREASAALDANLNTVRGALVTLAAAGEIREMPTAGPGKRWVAA